MELHQIRYFLALCETMNFTRAAQGCGVSQPSLTRAIKLLELELGGRLFNRERGNTHLTELGRAVRPLLQEVTVCLTTARAKAAAFAGLGPARLAVGVSFGFALVHVAEVLHRFAAAHRAVELVLIDNGEDEVRDALRRGEVELALLSCRPHDIDEFHYRRVGFERAALWLPAGHALRGAAEVPLAALTGGRLVTWAGSPFMAEVEHRMARAGLAPGGKALARTPALAAELFLRIGGLGLAARGFAPPPGTWACGITGLAEEEPVFVATKRGRPHSPVARTLLEMLPRPPDCAVGTA